MINPTDHPVHELIANRWSPYDFGDGDISRDDLRSLFEAARWAASAFNEQPWRFIVATRNDAEGFATAVSCLMEKNQQWAQKLPVIVFTAARKSFTRNDHPNGSAQHDLGMAVGNLVFEATARGLALHHMAGIDRDRIREVYSVPDEFDIMTAIAIGQSAEGVEPGARNRKPLAEIVFGGEFGKGAPLAG